MRRLAGLGLVLTLGACATVEPMPPPAPPPPALVCPAGQEPMRTAQLFFGLNIANQPGVTDAAFAQFVDQEITPRFPDGLTVMDGGGHWRGSENVLIREASKIVLIVLPNEGDAEQRIAAVRESYKARFRQDSVLLITQPSCVSF
jgi:hypothetical protein